jgi:hypothetical protein
MLITIALAAVLAALWFIAIYIIAEIAATWRRLFISPGVSDTTWAYAMRFVIIGILGFLYAVTAYITGNLWHMGLSLPVLLFGVVGAMTINQGFTVIPAKPIHRGILTYWGERQEILLDEGEHLLPKFWPLNMGVILEEVEAIEFRFVYEGVPCKGVPDQSDPTKPTIGATVTVEVVGAIQPDYDAEEMDEESHEMKSVGAKRLINYQNRGGKDTILTLLKGIIGQELREYSPDYFWEEFVRLKAPMAATLVSDLSVDRPRRLREMGAEIPDGVMKTDAKGYRGNQEIDVDPMEYIREAEGDVKESKRRHREMEAYLYQLRENGFGAIPDLGVQFLRFSIPAIEPEGAVKEANDKAAAEKKQREQEEQDADAEIAVAKKYLAADESGTMTLDRALQRRAINRGLAKEIILSGERAPLSDAAALNALGKD